MTAPHVRFTNGRRGYRFSSLLLLLLAGCVATPPRAPDLPDNLHWFRNAAERQAVYVEIYRNATEVVRQASQNLPADSWGVVLDIDETILDNSEYQKERALLGVGYSKASWGDWVSKHAASRLPGAKEFMDTVLDQLHGEVILVTNRSVAQCPVTERNLAEQSLRYSRIVCDSVGDLDKNARFDEIRKGTATTPALSVLAWLGDNIQDFPSSSQSSWDDRLFGILYFALPNPMYGSWQALPKR